MADLRRPRPWQMPALPDGWTQSGVTYGLLSLLAVGGYALLVTGGALILQRWLGWPGVLVSGLAAFGLALALSPLRRALQTQVEARFFRGRQVQGQKLEAFNRELAQAADLPAIYALVQRFCNEALAPAGFHIFMRDRLAALDSARQDGARQDGARQDGARQDGARQDGARQDGAREDAAPEGEFGAVQVGAQPASQVRFAAGGALARRLADSPAALCLDASAPSLEGAPPGEQARLALLGCQVFVPLSGRSGLVGWLACGPRRSGQAYSRSDFHFLEALSAQAGQAIERAQGMADLQRRVREMNVLMRVAQGANFTLVFDDLLELINAQTGQVIPAEDMGVWLIDPASQALYPVFYLENNERLPEKERGNMAGPVQGLELHVARSQQPLLTAEYAAACRELGYAPGREGVFAWMAAPLIAGGDTVGVISVGRRQAGEPFSLEQRGLLQAIGEQVCGAIVKARLMEETEQRARQLALLNEIGRSLTSTLELNKLLNLILRSAAEILGCTAGSLFLVDERTGDLVFEVVIGPVAGDLVGKRLPPGTGLVGEAVLNGRPVIANDVKRRKEWFEQTDQQTGFDTQDLLVAPMCVQDRVIGVIEVINKDNGLPFTPGDQELLMTFSSQATIAIENARLYMLTDQALTARVEELSVMQRIDHELNASLDLQRAMQITLEWALRQSQADGGLAGVLVDGEIQPVAEHTPAGEDAPPSAGLRLHEVNALSAALASGRPQVVRQGDGGLTPVHVAGAQVQLALPLCREASVIGVLLLESRQPERFDAERLAFLARLADHASIAVANAQLYGEVQAANLAKSKFVSFVAHELKNPMTVIKGNTELVAKGMAGPVNELQASFLGTVRANVDRMNTIVSDLNDLTKIQVGSLRLDYKTVDVAECVAEVTRSLARQLEDKQQRLIVDVPADLPPVWADPVRMNQIIMNLVSNAHKYTPAEGEIWIGADVLAASSGAGVEAESVHVWVRDTGIGIPPEDQEKIFQSYFRTEISKDAASGTGLGLNITRSLVQMQGGAIWFESKLGEGSSFHFALPRAEVG